MDANNILTNREYTLDEWSKLDNVLLIGRRGSTCIGLNDTNSDIDYLVVGKNSSEMEKQENIMLDTNLVTLSRFENMLSKMSIETIEALYNIEYVSKNFEENIDKYKQYVEGGGDVKFLFWYNIWLMLKNQLKQYYKGENNSKFASKIILYYSLLEDSNILDYWVSGKSINEDIRETYFRIRNGNISEEDVKLIEKINLERTDSKLREDYRSRYNKIMNNFKGF